jgi:hypothetical protein
MEQNREHGLLKRNKYIYLLVCVCDASIKCLCVYDASRKCLALHIIYFCVFSVGQGNHTIVKLLLMLEIHQLAVPQILQVGLCLSMELLVIALKM